MAPRFRRQEWRRSFLVSWLDSSVPFCKHGEMAKMKFQYGPCSLGLCLPFLLLACSLVPAMESVVLVDSVVMAMMAVCAAVLARQERVVVAWWFVAVEAFQSVEVAVVDFACFAASSEVRLEGMAGHLAAHAASPRVAADGSCWLPKMDRPGVSLEADSSSERTPGKACFLVASESHRRREWEKRDSVYPSLAIRACLDRSSVCRLHVSTDRLDSAMDRQLGFAKATW